GDSIHVSNEFFETQGKMLEDASDQHCRQHCDEITDVLQDRRRLGEEDAVAQQSAADAAYERKRKCTDRIIAAATCRPDPCHCHQKSGNKVELDRQQKRGWHLEKQMQ